MLIFLVVKVLLKHHSSVLSARISLLLRLFFVPAILSCMQLYHAFTLRNAIQESFIGHHEHHHASLGSNVMVFDSLPVLPKNESFGACLMIKEDNDLLYEWLAYHYTVLPLRYVFVGSDEGNQQDPSDVLRRWKAANTGLDYKIANATDFVNRWNDTGRAKSTQHDRADGKNDHEVAHHSFVRRQRAFVTTCVEHMKVNGMHWVTFIDTDEFVVLNRVDPMANLTKRENEGDHRAPNEVDPLAYQLRHALPPIESNQTVAQAMNMLKPIQNLSPCYTMPRLLYGALENVTCPAANAAVTTARSHFNYHEMSTLRFNLHAQKGDFSKSKYGKVIIDVSSLSETTIANTQPRNIHRPYKPECGHGAVGNFAESLFYLNHYIGSWERYSSRQDSRRNRQEWEMRAHLTTDSSCQHAVFQWFSRFLEVVGEERAKFLLGVNSEIEARRW